VTAHICFAARCHRIGQTRPVAVYRLITTNSVDVEMMEKQVSKKKLERMTIAGGDFRRAGRRTLGDFTFENLNMLLSSEIKDMHSKGADVEDVKISDEEFEAIMDRQRLFSVGPDAPPSEGKMYDLIDSQGGDVLGSMDAK
jgi:ATP-dependent DNA helicase